MSTGSQWAIIPEMGHLDKFRAVHPEPDLRGQQAIPSSLPSHCRNREGYSKGQLVESRGLPERLEAERGGHRSNTLRLRRNGQGGGV